MPYTDTKTDLILNELTEEQLHSQESLPPNQYWLTNEPSDNMPVPVGFYIICDSPTSPAERYGGEWEQIKDKFLLAAGDTYVAGDEGGSADAVIVAHTHLIKMSNDGVGSNGYMQMTKGSAEYTTDAPVGSTIDLNGNTTTETGAGKNMPPYLVVYVWKRIA